jgi:Mor family transcriptional regulator
MDISQCYEIKDIIGEEKYILLMKMYGGSNFYIEKYETHHRNERNQKIKKLSRQGLTNRQLSDRFNISIQQIRNILNS